MEAPIEWPRDSHGRPEVTAAESHAMYSVLGSVTAYHFEVMMPGYFPEFDTLGRAAKLQIERCEQLTGEMKARRKGGDMAVDNQVWDAWARLGAISIVAMMREVAERRPLKAVELNDFIYEIEGERGANR